MFAICGNNAVVLAAMIALSSEPRTPSSGASGRRDDDQCTACLANGRRIAGTLAFEKKRLNFTSRRGEAYPLADVARIVFAKTAPAPFRVSGGRRVHLRDGQQITGQLLGLNEEKLVLRTAWAERLELPRAALAAIDSLPGWQTVIEDDFHKGLRTFTAIGQTRSRTLTKPVATGRAGVNFREQGKARGARWTFEMLFQQGERARRFEVAVAGHADKYTIDSGGMEGVTRSVKRSPGWHRLIVTFSPRSLRITCDEEVLWYNLEQGPGGQLQKMSWHCHRIPGKETELAGAVAWEDFSLERAVDEHPKPPAVSELDSVRLSSGDQLFGRILQADRRGITVDGRFGKRALSWSAVAGCCFRRASERSRNSEHLNEGANVRILLCSGLCSEADMVEGEVTALDQRHLMVRHALLGELTLPLDRLRELRPLFRVSEASPKRR